jgi:hypothetical protein
MLTAVRCPVLGVKVCSGVLLLLFPLERVLETDMPLKLDGVGVEGPANDDGVGSGERKVGDGGAEAVSANFGTKLAMPFLLAMPVIKKMTVNIHPVAFDNQNTENHPWKQPRVTIILGGVGSGKTTILMNILNEISNDTFHRAIIFSSNKLDAKMVDTISEDVELYGADKSKLDTVIAEIRQDALNAKRSKKKIPKILLVLDDVAGDGNFFNSNKSLFNNFILSTRHYNTTVILTTQKYKLIPPVIRVNANIWFINRLSPEERKQIFIDLPFPKDRLEKAYNLATSKAYNWLQINLSKGLLIKDFNEVLDV